MPEYELDEEAENANKGNDTQHEVQEALNDQKTTTKWLKMNQ